MFFSNYADIIAAAPQAFRDGVLNFLANSGENDTEPSNDAITTIVKALPNLKYINISGNEIADRAMEDCFASCLDLEDFSMSTNFGEEARLNGSALRRLAENAAWCPNLREMTLDGYLTLGLELREALKVLSRARRGLVIETEDMVNLQSSVWKGGNEVVEDYGDDSEDEDEDDDEDGEDDDDDEDEDGETDMEELRYEFMRAEIMERFTTPGAQQAALTALEMGDDMTEFGFEDDRPFGSGDDEDSD